MAVEDKPLEGAPKGINTGGEDPKAEKAQSVDNILPAFNIDDLYKVPKTPEDARIAESAGAFFSGVTSQKIPGKISQGFDPKLFELYGDINLTNAIPDQYEREKYKEEYGDKFIKGLDPNIFKIQFEDDALDYSRFIENKFNREQKKFLDELDENQGFLSELGHTLVKFAGLTANAVTGLVPLTYGLAKGLFTWDAQNIFNNEVFDQWEAQDHYLNKKFAVYGGSSYYEGDKGFGARFKNNPMKSLNADIVPAAAFVAGAVLTEVAAGAAATVTGGTTLVANTSRLAAQGTRLFGSGVSNVAKGMKVIRGIDTLSDFQKARQVASLAQKYRAGIGTATSMVRSAGYESSLIARETYTATINKAKANYINSNTILSTKADALRKQGYSEDAIIVALENEIPENIKNRMQYQAEQAGELAWFTNIPLVGASNLIQFGKALGWSYKFGKSLPKLGKINPLRGTSINKATGQVVANADKVGKFKKYLGYSMVAAKDGFTEGFEEFSQGAMTEGYSDYYASPFTNESLSTSVGFLDAMSKASSKYWNSTEGQDSVLIGGLMGMVGIGLPVKIDSKTGKVGFGFQWYGGAYQEIKDLKEEIKKDRFNAEERNKTSVNKNLKENFENLTREITTQEEMNKALESGDLFNFKNKEYESLHSFVSSRFNVGLEDTILQDIEAMGKVPLEQFNKDFAFKGGEFTEESRRKNLEKVKDRVNNIIKAHKHVDLVFNDRAAALEKKIRKNYPNIKNPVELLEGIKKQMTFLYGSSINLAEREQDLTKQLNNLTKSSVDLSVLDKLLETPEAVRAVTKETTVKDEEGKETTTKQKEEQIGYLSDVRDFYTATLQEIKKADPKNYALHKQEIQNTLKDLIKIKQRAAKTAGIYETLFTKKGEEKFITLYDSLLTARNEIIAEILEKQREEEIKNAKSSNRVKSVSENEQSITGENTAESNKVSQEIQDIEDRAIAEAIAEAEGSQDLSEIINNQDQDTIIANLEKSPGLFNQILQYLEKQGTPLPGVTNIDQLAEVIASNPTALNNIINAYKALINQYNNIVEKPEVRLDYAEEEGYNNIAPTSEDIEEDPEEFLNSLISKSIENTSYNSDNNISDNSFIPVSHDKKLNKVDGKYKIERDENTGKYIEWNYNGIPSNQPIDNAKINSPNFLNNKELKDNEVMASFIIADTEYNQNLTDKNFKNVEIHIYQEDTFIGTLPNIYDNKKYPENFVNLRKAIFEQQEGSPQGIQVVTNISKELREQLNTMGYSNPKVDKLTKEEREYIVRNGIPVEEFVSREENIKENFENITKQIEDLVERSFIPGSELNEIMSKFMDETGQFKKC